MTTTLFRRLWLMTTLRPTTRLRSPGRLWTARACLPAAMLSLACGGGSAERPPPAESPGGPALNPPSVDEQLASLTAAARAEGVVEEIHGVEVTDPFRVLESMDSEVTASWVAAQTERTADALGSLPDDRRERLAAWLSTGVVSSPALGGERVFYTLREGEREQPLLVSRPIDSGDPEAEPAVHVDPGDWGERAAIDWFFPSPGGRYLAFGISQNGDERSTLYLIEVASGERLDADTIPRTKWCRLAWLHDDAGFYYTRYPAPGEPDYDPDEPESYHRRLFFHRVGTDPAEDPLVFAPRDGRHSVAPAVSEDDRWLTLNVFHGWASSDLYLLDRGRSPGSRVDVPDDGHPLEAIFVDRDSIAYGGVHRSRLYVLTNDGAPRYRIDVARRPDQAPRDPESAFRVLVPESEEPIESFAVTKNRLVVEVVDELASSVRVYDFLGKRRDDLALPARGSIEGLDAEALGERVAFFHQGYLSAPSIRLAEPRKPENIQVVESVSLPEDADLSAYETQVARARSEDGTEVPFTILRPKDLAEAPRVIVTGYGGFNISLLPAFRREALYWVEQGGVFVVANLRGGGEYGETWHEAGNRGEKERVFEDFEAVLRWFPAEGVTTSDRIGITGRSNGGLLMGAAITRAPDAFGAAAAYVGLYDMVRFVRFPPAQLWTGEYGDPAVAEDFRWLLAYSPYHQVEPGTAYPAVLVEAAEADTRVHWAHSSKFAARLQEATSGSEPIYFYLQRQMGHGRGTRRSDLVDLFARMFAFFDQELG
ncbi:MAG TPA: prolyl oligopeptidase family serine peptidase [Polyangiaceae bacterium LLY-WYZ-14_1]|nr:prolyl oligopeptidase family serine peptidase [Polyangiaceae bacterium LLY-WYZ-14_1]